MASKLDPHIDDIIESLVEGKTYREIAKAHKVALSTLHKFLTSSEHSARANQALATSASHYANKAEQVLIDAENDKIEIQRARELAHHYRWMAGKRNPGKYGERKQQDITIVAEQPVFNLSDEVQTDDSDKEAL